MFSGKLLKDWEKALIFGLIVTLILSFVSFNAECDSIRTDVLRLHILANSDSEQDQALKLKVRDAVLQATGDNLSNTKSLSEALSYVNGHKHDILTAARQVILQNGYNYPVEVTVGKSYFSTRHYDGYTLPAGEYTALKIMIGKAMGANWWCVMYPSLCLSSCINYDNALDSSEQEIVENYQKYEIKFKSVEVLESIKNYFFG